MKLQDPREPFSFLTQIRMGMYQLTFPPLVLPRRRRA